MKCIGFDIGGTKCAVCVGEISEDSVKIIDKKIIKTEKGADPYRIIEQMCEIAEELTDDFSRVGISCGGPLDSKNGIIKSPPNLIGWDNIKIVDYIKNRWGGSVKLQNDANACAVAEWKFGAGRGCENMIFLTFGTGFGAGLILNGRLYSGTSDMAGEVGHIKISERGPVAYGRQGTCEGFCSGGGLAQLGRTKALELLQVGKTASFCKSLYELDLINAKDIADCANQGFSDAIEVYEESARKLGYTLSILIDLFNPEKIVIGSIFQRAENLIRPEMEKVIEEESLIYAREVCKVVPAELKENLGDYAALAIAAME